MITACRWGQTIREHVQGGLQLHLSSSSEPPDCAVAALAELFAADCRSESSDACNYACFNAPLSLTFGKVGQLNHGMSMDWTISGTKPLDVCAR